MYNNQAPRMNEQYPQSNQFSNTNQNNQTSSAVPFPPQSYPNNPETPDYPQKNPQQQTMAEKYPLQIWVAARAGMSLTCASDLHSPEENDIRNSPMEMHTGTSVFRMAIAYSKKGSVVANIPAKDIPYLLEQYQFQRNMLHQQMLKKPNTPAYTVPIKERNCQNKTAAEVLQMQNGMNILTNARKFFANNLDRYPANGQMVNAIDEALSLYQSRRLVSSVTLSPLYKSAVKPKSTKDENGRNTVYSITISGSASSSVDWTFELYNCKAFLKNMGKLKVVDMEHAVDKKTLTFKVTQQEMDLFIYRLRSTMENYERSMFLRQYKMAQKHVKYGRDRNTQ